MNAKLSNFSELSNILSVKSSLRTNLMSLFTRFGLGHLLCRMSLEKQAGIPAVQLILSLCLFRIAGESYTPCTRSHRQFSFYLLRSCNLDYAVCII